MEEVQTLIDKHLAAIDADVAHLSSYELSMFWSAIGIHAEDAERKADFHIKSIES